MEKRVANIPITSCKDCPFFEKSYYPTDDSRERADYWWCTKVKDPEEKNNSNQWKKIQGYVEWTDEKNIEIPEWCPLTK